MNIFQENDRQIFKLLKRLWLNNLQFIILIVLDFFYLLLLFLFYFYCIHKYSKYCVFNG